MKNKLKKIMATLLFFSLIIISISLVSAADYGDIRTQVNSATNGSTINLASNTYTSDGSHIHISSKDITITGASNSNRATLNGQDTTRAFFVDADSKLTLRYINFIGASAPTYNAISVHGTLFIDNCTFSSCNGDSGAAIYLHNDSIGSRIVNTRFINNFADNDGTNDYTAGGAICVSGADNVEIRNCYFSGNAALNGGGAIVVRNGAQNTKIIGCEFVNNILADGFGGAIYNQRSTGTVISNCIFTNNKATADRGGAIFSTDDLTITDCTFTGNSAKNGGAIYSTSTLTISSSKFSKNKASSQGGAIYSANLLNITGGTISGNTATYGSGVYNSGTLRLNGVNLANNVAKTIAIVIQSPTSVVKGNYLVIKSYLIYGDNVVGGIYTKNTNVYKNNVQPAISNKGVGKSITLKFNNKKYTVKSNSAGISTFKISIPETFKSGTFKATVSYLNSGKTFSKSKNVKVTAKKVKTTKKITNKRGIKVNNKSWVTRNNGKITKGKIKTTKVKNSGKIVNGKKRIRTLKSMKVAKIEVEKLKKNNPKSTKSIIRESYKYKNKKMKWEKVSKEINNIDKAPAGLRNNTKITTYKYTITSAKKTTYNKKTKVTTTYKVLCNIKGYKDKKVVLITYTKQKCINYPNKYLVDTANAPVNDADIRKLAKTITKACKKDDYYAKAKVIYKWVQVHTDYTLNTNNTSAKDVLSKKGPNGNYKAYCVGFSNVMAALCRAVDVPVRYRAMFFYESEEIPFCAHSGHVYTQVYVKGNWTNADAATSGFIAPLGYKGNLHKKPTDSGGSVYSHVNAANYWEYTCNHIFSLKGHHDVNIVKSFGGNRDHEYFKLDIKITSATQAYNVLYDKSKKSLRDKGYKISKNKYFTGSIAYIKSGDYIPMWAFRYSNKTNNKFAGYIIIDQNGVIYEVFEGYSYELWCI